MPTNKIKHDVKKGLGSEKSLEKKWHKAEDIAKKGAKNKKNPYPLAMHIYENSLKSANLMTSNPEVILHAATRLQNDLEGS